jgi:hypothetical protein
MQLYISILLLKISNLFSNCAQKSPWTSCLATPDNRYIVWLWWKHHDFWSCAMLYQVNASMHLLVKKLRERVTLTFTDPKMHYCCWAFKRAEFRCSFVDVRACESNSGSHVAREPIQHSLGSKPEQNIKSGMFSFYLLGKFANTASKWIRIPKGKKWNHCKQGLVVCAPKRI